MSHIRSASTVLMIRKAADSSEQGNQYQLYTIKRPDTMRFLPGYTAFPGGAVEEQDVVGEWVEYVTSHDIRSWMMLPPKTYRADEPYIDTHTLLVHGITALRELFEETGVLLCRHNDHVKGECTFLTVQDHQLVRDERQALIEQKTSFLQLIKRLQVKLDTRCLLHIGTRLTPPSKPLRFDTQFFITYVPASLTLSPLPGEIAGEEWVSPTVALEKIQENIISCAPPTIECFSILAQELQLKERELVARIQA